MTGSRRCTISVERVPVSGYGAHTWYSLTESESTCIKLVDPDIFCGEKVFSKYLHFLHYLHWSKLSEETASFGKQCTFGRSYLHCFCTICTICPRWLTGVGIHLLPSRERRLMIKVHS